eukprot:jgi/Chrzof1/6535/Cz19g00070.t1
MILRSLRVRASPAALLPLADACVLDICIKKHQPPLPLRVPKNNKAQVARARKFANSFKGCFCAAPTHQVDAFGTHATKSAKMYCSAASDVKSDTIASVHDEEPIIVTASWLGARTKPFSKYKQLWRCLGYNDVVSVRPPMSAIMFPAVGQLAAAHFVKRVLSAARRRPRAPVLVHLFSGGGFIFMSWMFAILKDMAKTRPDAADVLNRIKGIILDSSPAMVNADVSSRALVAAALGQPAEGIEQSTTPG